MTRLALRVETSQLLSAALAQATITSPWAHSPLSLSLLTSEWEIGVLELLLSLPHGRCWLQSSDLTCPVTLCKPSTSSSLELAIFQGHGTQDSSPRYNTQKVKRLLNTKYLGGYCSVNPGRSFTGWMLSGPPCQIQLLTTLLMGMITGCLPSRGSYSRQQALEEASHGCWNASSLSCTMQGVIHLPSHPETLPWLGSAPSPYWWVTVLSMAQSQPWGERAQPSSTPESPIGSPGCLHTGSTASILLSFPRPGSQNGYQPRNWNHQFLLLQLERRMLCYPTPPSPSPPTSNPSMRSLIPPASRSLWNPAISFMHTVTTTVL